MIPDTIQNGRDAVGRKDQSHADLYAAHRPGIDPAPDHRPILQQLREDLSGEGFAGISEFMQASRQADREDYRQVHDVPVVSKRPENPGQGQQAYVDPEGRVWQWDGERWIDPVGYWR